MSKYKISDLSMQPAENGVIISYCKKKEPKYKGSYDNCTYEYPKEVFNSPEEAFMRFKELWMEAFPGKKEMEEEDDD